MKNKKIVWIFTILLIIVLIAGYYGIKYAKEKQAQTSTQDYTPQEEITEEQFRQTIVSLYFPNKETDELMPEARLVDIREIMNNPYERLINLLVEGPKSDKTKKIIPENTKVLRTFMEGDCVTVDFSKDFLEYSKQDEKQKKMIVDSIVNTLTELTEVNKVKFLIEGETKDELKEVYERGK